MDVQRLFKKRIGHVFSAPLRFFLSGWLFGSSPLIYSTGVYRSNLAADILAEFSIIPVSVTSYILATAQSLFILY